MSKLSIDLMYSDITGHQEEISNKMLQAVTTGCQRTLKKLGPLAELVTVFRVTFHGRGHATEEFFYGPEFIVYLKNLLGKEASLTADYRFIGSGKHKPSPSEIVDFFLKELPPLMKEHLQKGKGELEKTQIKIARLLDV